MDLVGNKRDRNSQLRLGAVRTREAIVIQEICCLRQLYMKRLSL